MPAAMTKKPEANGESSTAAYKAQTANPSGNPTYELPWYVSEFSLLYSSKWLTC